MGTLSSLHNVSTSLSLLTKPSLSLSPFLRPIRSLPPITCSSLQFNITFAPPKPKPKPKPPPNLKTDAVLDSDSPPLPPDGQFFIPWIVRGEDGNLKLQAHPPSHLINALADAKTQKPKKKAVKAVKKEKEISAVGNASVEQPPPKLSKAARRFYNENFRQPPQRLSKVLAAAGVASRRESEELIFDGKVTVNGSVCNAPQTRVDPAKDIIYVNGSRLPKRLPPKVYLALNKPKGYICSSGEKEFRSVLDLFEDYLKRWDKMNPGSPKPRLFTVGRLDVATTGLIIVTNDGDFAQKLSHPSSNFHKEYIATIDGEVKNRHLIAISEGTEIEGIHCIPDSVELLPRQPDSSRPRLRVVVHEGRNHEVRELVKNAGLEIHSLKRVRIGGFRLPADLGLGKHIELNQSDLRAMGWKS
ncbi:putative ribosomal large subunit pseudouridine synthase SVR1, chloroplastic [Durio zibethinus]|uniref:Ribosomal large subunit pseudouridine synthase SVR1, chloroplastic n=1 Tax=Durio zibethinus TaxID=66656 RepID=A0A6P6AKQ5_DURZI|nr:putative ribosomal large subunit pseudouridine synthase SVR1, chloroplastic [Durio zibethinus]